MKAITAIPQMFDAMEIALKQLEDSADHNEIRRENYKGIAELKAAMLAAGYTEWKH